MDETRWTRAQEIFHELVELPASERPARLERRCGDDAALRGVVESMLRADAGDDSLLEPPAAADVERALRRDTGPLRPRSRLGPWRIGDEIASGGMGTVFRAERVDGAFEQTVAVKIIRAGFDSQDLLHRFRNERRTLARLQHENIARLVDGGATDAGLPWLAMEFVDGRPLDVYCREQALDVDRRIDLFRVVLEAVSFAHRNLVVHRDLKPTNILVTDDGVPKLLDFGIAKMLEPEDGATTTELGPRTRTHARVMTPEYASPEQVRGEPVTTASDVYALGVVLYELLTDQRPYRRATTRAALERAICDETPPPPSTVRRLSRELDTIVFAAMHKDPTRRYASVDALTEDLRRFRADLPILARRDSLAYRARKYARRNRVGTTMLLIASLAVVGGTVFSARWAIRAEEQRARADENAARLAAESARLREVNLFLEELLAAPDPRVAGRDVRVVDALEHARERLECRLGDSPEIELSLRLILGRTCFGLGLLEEARRYQEEVLAQVDDVFPNDPVLRARARHQLADTLTRLGRRDESAALFDAALEVIGDADLATRAGVLSLSGSLAVARGAREEGIARMREAIVLSERLPDDQPERALCLVRLGRHLAFQRKELDEAEAMLGRAIAWYERHYAPDHPAILEAKAALATCTLERGRAEEARDVLTALLPRMRARLGAEHPDLLIPLGTFGRALLLLGDVPGARETAREALALAESHFDDDHPGIAPALSNLAMVLRQVGDAEGCEQAYFRALDIQVRTQGEEHPDTALLRHNFAVFLLFSGRFDEAEPLLHRALEVQLRTEGDAHVRTAETLHSIAFLHRQQNDHEGALPWFRRALDVWRAALPADHPRLTNVFYLIGSCEWKNGEPERGRALLEECLGLQAKLPGTPPPQRAATQEMLAACLTDLGRLDEAEELFEEAVPVLVATFGEESEHVKQARARQARVIEARDG